MNIAKWRVPFLSRRLCLFISSRFAVFHADKSEVFDFFCILKSRSPGLHKEKTTEKTTRKFFIYLLRSNNFRKNILIFTIKKHFLTRPHFPNFSSFCNFKLLDPLPRRKYKNTWKTYAFRSPFHFERCIRKNICTNIYNRKILIHVFWCLFNFTAYSAF